MSLFNFIKPKHDMPLAFSVDGIERVVYGETDKVLDRLQAVGAALALFPIKKDAAPEPSMKWMYEFTDGMTPEQVQEAFDGVISLTETLKTGSETPYHADGTLTTNKAGALLTWNGTTVGFPFQGVSQRMQGGHDQRRLAERGGDSLHLSLIVDGGDEVASTCTWNVDYASGHIGFSVREARYWQIKDYGRVLLNQVIEASGKLQR